jgi:diguanylate cyclase (GGDEF)-like protein
MEGGTLVFHAAAGAAVGLLLPDGLDAARLERVEDDLRRLLDGLRRRPQIIALAQARTAEVSLESSGSVGLRLAYQLERSLDGQVIVAAAESGLELSRNGDAARRVRVIGVSGRGDRRLLDTVLPAESDLARVAVGELDQRVTHTDPLGGAVADRRQRPGTALLLPIRAGERPVGAVAIWPTSGKEPVGALRVELMETLAHAGPRIATALEADRMKHRASADPLTGLHNRRGLEEVLSRRDAGDGALIYADFDRFKLLNDTLGHPAGDAALIHFARIIREQIRGGDVAARIGGEEFAIWMPHTPIESGLEVAERIRAGVESTAWRWNGEAYPLTISCGVAGYPDNASTVDSLRVIADAALYRAKQGGRNRVERAQGEPMRYTG